MAEIVTIEIDEKLDNWLSYLANLMNVDKSELIKGCLVGHMASHFYLGIDDKRIGTYRAYDEFIQS